MLKLVVVTMVSYHDTLENVDLFSRLPLCHTELMVNTLWKDWLPVFFLQLVDLDLLYWTEQTIPCLA